MATYLLLAAVPILEALLESLVPGLDEIGTLFLLVGDTDFLGESGSLSFEPDLEETRDFWGDLLRVEGLDEPFLGPFRPLEGDLEIL